MRQPSPILGGKSQVHVDFGLQPSDGGTLLTCRGPRPTGSKGQRALVRVIHRAMRPMIRRNLEKVKREIEEDASSRESMPGALLSQGAIDAAAEIGVRADET